MSDDAQVSNVERAIRRDLREARQKVWREQEKLAMRRLKDYRKRKLVAVPWSEAPTRSFPRSAVGKRIQFLEVAIDDASNFHRIGWSDRRVGAEEELWAEIAATVDRASSDPEAGEAFGTRMRRLPLSDFFGLVICHTGESVVTVTSIFGLGRRVARPDDDPPSPLAAAAALDRVRTSYVSAVAKMNDPEGGTAPSFAVTQTRMTAMRNRRIAHMIREIITLDK